MIRLLGNGKEGVVKTMERMVRKKENSHVFYLGIFQGLLIKEQ